MSHCYLCLGADGPESYSADMLVAVIASLVRDHRYSRGGGTSEIDAGDQNRGRMILEFVQQHDGRGEAP